MLWIDQGTLCCVYRNKENSPVLFFTFADVLVCVASFTSSHHTHCLFTSISNLHLSEFLAQIRTIVGEYDHPAPSITLEAKSHSVITQHIESAPTCLQSACSEVSSYFGVVVRGRSKSHLNVLGAIFITTD